MRLARTIAVLFAVVLIIVQPALAVCQCTNCGGACSRQHALQAATKSCCAAHNGKMSCCGAKPGSCLCCSSKHDASKPGSHAGNTGCLCSSQPHASAISTSYVQVDHAKFVGHVAFIGDLPTNFATSSAHSPLASLHYGPPPRYGGLRPHAYLGVWII